MRPPLASQWEIFPLGRSTIAEWSMSQSVGSFRLMSPATSLSTRFLFWGVATEDISCCADVYPLCCYNLAIPLTNMTSGCAYIFYCLYSFPATSSFDEWLVARGVLKRGVRLLFVLCRSVRIPWDPSHPSQSVAVRSHQIDAEQFHWCKEPLLEKATIRRGFWK